MYNTKATKEDTQELNCEWYTVKNEDETQEFKDLYHKSEHKTCHVTQTVAEQDELFAKFGKEKHFSYTGRKHIPDPDKYLKVHPEKSLDFLQCNLVPGISSHQN